MKIRGILQRNTGILCDAVKVTAVLGKIRTVLRTETTFFQASQRRIYCLPFVLCLINSRAAVTGLRLNMEWRGCCHESCVNSGAETGNLCGRHCRIRPAVLIRSGYLF